LLAKGGHDGGERVVDRLYRRDGSTVCFEHRRQPWGLDRSHGTGCRLAAAVAAALGRGAALDRGVAMAEDYLVTSCNKIKN